MPIIANTIVVVSQQSDGQIVENHIIKRKKPPVIETNEENQTVLMVNGKPKKISKKSQYLLDMLNLDEE